MHQEITHDQLEEIVRINLATGEWQPIILLGAPGGGKSWFARHRLPEIYAEVLGLERDEIGYKEENPARRDAAEIAGVALPSRDENGNVYTQFTISPVAKAIQDSGLLYGVMNWEELAAARDPEQKVCTDSMDPAAHYIGNPDTGKLPKGWIVVASGNRAQDKAGSTRLLSHLTNRALVFNLKFCIKSWQRWAEANGVNPVVIDCAAHHYDSGFFADAVPAEDMAYCTPRSLTRAAKHIDAYMESPEFTGTLPPVVERMVAANIGPAAARIVVQWFNQFDKVPKVADILRDPDGAMVPDQTGFQMIAAHALIGAVDDAATAGAALRYIVRLRPDLQVSLGTKLMRVSSQAGWMITDPAASEFIAKFHDLLPLAWQD